MAYRSMYQDRAAATRTRSASNGRTVQRVASRHAKATYAAVKDPNMPRNRPQVPAADQSRPPSAAFQNGRLQAASRYTALTSTSVSVCSVGRSMRMGVEYRREHGGHPGAWG